MDDIEQVFVYLEQLLHVLVNRADFNLGKYKIINKTKIDDVLCCLQSALPKDFKQGLQLGSKYRSIAAYNELVAAVHKKVPLSSGMYMISLKDVQRDVSLIRQTIRRDSEQLAIQYG